MLSMMHLQLRVSHINPQDLQVMLGAMHVPLTDLQVMHAQGADLLPNALVVPVK